MGKVVRFTMAVMPSDDLAARIRTASRSCPDAVSGQVFRSPAQAFADLAQSCAELGIEEWDFYGESGPVGRLEAELVELFGVEAAALGSLSLAHRYEDPTAGSASTARQ